MSATDSHNLLVDVKRIHNLFHVPYFNLSTRLLLGIGDTFCCQDRPTNLHVLGACLSVCTAPSLRVLLKSWSSALSWGIAVFLLGSVGFFIWLRITYLEFVVVVSFLYASKLFREAKIVFKVYSGQLRINMRKFDHKPVRLYFKGCHVVAAERWHELKALKWVVGARCNFILEELLNARAFVLESINLWAIHTDGPKSVSANKTTAVFCPVTVKRVVHDGGVHRVVTELLKLLD